TGSGNPLDGHDLGAYVTPTFVDIDNDGDFDMFAGDNSGRISYFRNDGTTVSPAFTYVGVNQLGFLDEGNKASITFGDLDGDGDADALVTDDTGSVAYYRNTGTASAPAFTKVGDNQMGITAAAGELGVALVDIDNDGDLDLFRGRSDGTIAYQENIGDAANPIFSAVQSNVFSLTEDVGDWAKIEFVDIDGDGDQDLFVGDKLGFTHFYENTGTASNPTFAAGVTSPFGFGDIGAGAAPTAVDIDNDGDFDVVTGSSDGTFLWFENTAGISVDTTTAQSYDVTVRATDSGGLSYDETLTISTGTAGDDTITGHATQDNIIYGLGGSDTLTGGSGNDMLVAGEGSTGADRGLVFDGVDDQIHLNSLTVNTAAGAKTTVEFWMYWTGNSNEMPIGFYDGTNKYDLYFSGSNFGFNTGNFDVYGISTTGLANGWHHVTAVFTNGDVTQNKLYIDGVDQSLTQRQGTPLSSKVGADATISGWPADSSTAFTGQLADVRVWDGERTAGEVVADMNDPVDSGDNGATSLIASYGLTGGDYTDYSGNGHTGAAIGNPDTNLSANPLPGGATFSTLIGGLGDDTLLGNTGDDILTGGAGDDILIGGTGDDTAIFTGNFSDYTFDDAGNGSITVTDTRAGADGTDKVSGVETLQFADQSISVIEGTAGADTLTGGAATDILVGGAGDDVLSGDVSPDYAMDFEMSETDRIMADMTGAITNQYTISFELTPESLSNYNQGVAMGNGGSGGWGWFSFHTTSDGSVYVGTDVGTRFTPTDLGAGTLTVGETHTYTFTFDNGTACFYKDGALLATKSMNLPGTITYFDLHSTLDGLVDDVQVYDKALNATEVQTVADGGVISGSNLLLHYDFEGADPYADKSGSGRDGQVSGTPTQVLASGGSSSDDVLFGGDGNDTLDGGGGNDTLDGGAGNDTAYGDAGSDLFRFAMGDGHDTISGGAAGGWTDAIEISGTDNSYVSSTATTYVTADWTLVIDSGTITSENGTSLDLSDDASGTITFDDGSQIDFIEMERIDW
ncbi:MAG: VCBS repeat-containing protein, partial [Hyphomicrobiales bacterium]|nr:VCBS repeat-containing protein [Hyphomicrobiales bacterium]